MIYLNESNFILQSNQIKSNQIKSNQKKLNYLFDSRTYEEQIFKLQVHGKVHHNITLMCMYLFLIDYSNILPRIIEYIQ